MLCFFVGLVSLFVVYPIRLYKAIKNGGINIGTRRVDERGNNRDFGRIDRDYNRDFGRTNLTDGNIRNFDKFYNVGDNERGIDDLNNNDCSTDLGR